jgi:hypothetical protein
MVCFGGFWTDDEEVAETQTANDATAHPAAQWTVELDGLSSLAL